MPTGANGRKAAILFARIDGLKYVVHAYDPQDEGALERRMLVRPRHLENTRRLKEEGQFLLGGALLDPEGRMIGSMMLMEFANQAELDDWVATEPYIVERVWERVDIKPFRQADI